MTLVSVDFPPGLSQVASFDDLPPLANRPGTLADQVHEVLLEAILDGTLPPGSHLKAEGLTRRYGLSIIPVREALRALQAAGWVVSRPHHGSFVRSLSRKELDEINEFRGVIEVAASRLAAERRSDADMDLLRGIVAEGFDLVGAREFGKFPDMNSRFHDAVAAAAGNQVMRESQQVLNQRVRLYTRAIDLERIEASAHEHARIVEAIDAGDAAAAGALAAEHLDNSLRRVRGLDPS